LEVFYKVSGFLPNINIVVFLEIGDEELVIGDPFTDNNGEGGGGFTTPATAPGPYTLTAYEDKNHNLVPDAGGAQASTSFTCEVTPELAVQKLIDTIDNMDLSRGTTASLETTLNAAMRQLDRNNDESACSQFDIFLNKVDVRENNGRLTSQQATDLRQQATAIQEELGCTTSTDTNLPSALSSP
jgi:FIMAH domain